MSFSARRLFAHAKLLASLVPNGIYDSLTIDSRKRVEIPTGSKLLQLVAVRHFLPRDGKFLPSAAILAGRRDMGGARASPMFLYPPETNSLRPEADSSTLP